MGAMFQPRLALIEERCHLRALVAGVIALIAQHRADRRHVQRQLRLGIVVGVDDDPGVGCAAR